MSFSLAAVSGSYSPAAVCGLLSAVAPLVVEHSLSGMWDSAVVAPGSKAQAQQLCLTGLVAPRRVGSSQTGDRTRVFCIVRRILYH